MADTELDAITKWLAELKAKYQTLEARVQHLEQGFRRLPAEDAGTTRPDSIQSP